jgi:hypothetical protein
MSAAMRAFKMINEMCGLRMYSNRLDV